ncbi:NfeD family protein [Crateriforma conspicua]|uniref:NfeD family protein n=1 Tax=Crateriforma conspicua TaxID=2527996 RepID=UPI00118ACAD4|nr:NfeD family protein [Crateriforma conspicua]QDV63174.1 hypothetical protein Mal65_23160 [Crateriforma conspicua]
MGVVRRTIVIAVWIIGAIGLSSAISAQNSDDIDPTAGQGVWIDIAPPFSRGLVDDVLAGLDQLAQSTPSDSRRTVVLAFRESASDVQTEFEEALRLARRINSPDYRRLRIVAFVDGQITRHAVLPLAAVERLMLSNNAVLVGFDSKQDSIDETVQAAYQAIAKRRGLFPESLVSALVDPDGELVRLTTSDGGRPLVTGDELQSMRQSGDVIEEDIWKASGEALSVSAVQLRDLRVATDVIATGRRDDETTAQKIRESLASRLDLRELRPLATDDGASDRRGVLLEMIGSVTTAKSQRWQSNLNATLSGDVNTWLVSVDSDGGSFGESMGLAGWFASPTPPLQRVVGFVPGRAIGDASIIATACKPLYLSPDAKLGGPGADSIQPEQVADQRELIELIARRTNRSAGLLMGLLDRQRQVFRYTNKQTGRVRYATQQQLVDDADDPDLERDRWMQGEAIDLSSGLTAEQAVQLGLADGIASSLDQVAAQAGLSAVPAPAADRGIVRAVESIGRRQGLAFLALMIGFMMLSTEMSAPGLGIPGFVSMICFGFFFWVQYLNGTAEWLELLALVLGLVCIAIEFFVVPGLGVFGIGGLLLTMLAVVLMSQTFVVPRNVYQVEVLTRSVWMALGGLASTMAGFALIRYFMPHLPVLNTLVMEQPDAQLIDQQERLAHFEDLLGQTGTTMTPLRPSGKARIGERVVAVVSDGQAVERGATVRVIKVLGNRIVVEEAT